MESEITDSEYEFQLEGTDSELDPAIEAEPPDRKDKKKPVVRLNRAIIIEGISRVQIDKRDTVELDKQFYKVTHLHLQRKGIEVLDSLHLFHNLTVLYLYENKIRSIEGLEAAAHLEILYLQKNRLARLNGLLECKRLRKLFLGNNEISLVEGLEQLGCLEELHVEYQNLPNGDQLLFDPSSLDILSTCLRVLNISGNQVQTLEDFAGLQELHTLKANDNLISDLDNTSLIVSTLKRLKNLDLRENPITKYHKYKEKLIGFGSTSLELLDDKVVTATTRQFIKKFCEMKAKNLQHVVDSFGGSPALMPSNPASNMAFQYSSPPVRVSKSKFEEARDREEYRRPRPNLPKDQQKQVEHILRRLYPKERKQVKKSGKNSELQSKANQLVRASGSKLVKPQEISIPQFVLASSTALKGELGIMSEGEMEEARAVTRGTTPGTAESSYELGTSGRNGIELQSATDILAPRRAPSGDSAQLVAERFYLEQTDAKHRLAEMNRHLFGTKPKKKTKKKVKANAQPEVQTEPEREIIPVMAKWSITRTSPDALRLSQIKQPPKMKDFDPSRTGSQMEMGTMTPLSLRGYNPHTTAMKEPGSPQPDPFSEWASQTMVQGKYGFRPRGEPEFQPDRITSRLEEIAEAQTLMPWPPEGITQAQGFWLAQQEGQPRGQLQLEREEYGVVWTPPPGVSGTSSLTPDQQEIRAQYMAYQTQLAAQGREAERNHGSSLQAVGLGQNLSWLQQQYMLGSSKPNIHGSEFLPSQKSSLSERKVEPSSSAPVVQPFVTQVYELPPWPHILRNLGSQDPKVTYMP